MHIFSKASPFSMQTDLKKRKGMDIEDLLKELEQKRQ
jgi:hypothetical protein